MKIAILGDTHFGSRSDGAQFHSIFDKFYNNIFFPALKDRGVEALIQLGDLFDRRKYVNYLTLAQSREYFFDKLKAMNMPTHILLGNHCIFYKNTLEVNSPELLLKEYDNIIIHKAPNMITLGGKNIDMIPWICKDNEEETFAFIENSKANLCMGHFELAGFAMSSWEICNSGLSGSFLNKYGAVFSGHFHQRSVRDNIIYTGSPYQLTWSDYGDDRGFYIYCTETDDLEFIENPYSLFKKINYDDNLPMESFDQYENCYVKIVLSSKKNEDRFNLFIDKLQEKNPLVIQIIDETEKIVLDDLGEEISEVEDTSAIIRKYIKNLNFDDSDSLEVLFNELYNSALNME